MKALTFRISSEVAEFTKPTSNNDPDTYLIPTKSSIIGLLLATIGIDKEYCMTHNLYKILSESIKYSVSLNKRINKKIWSEYYYSHNNVFKPISERPFCSPKSKQRLIEPDYNIILLYDGRH